MSTQKSSSPQVATENNTQSRTIVIRVLLLRILGGLLLLYSFAWLYLIYIYLVLFVHDTLPNYPDSSRENVALFMHLPQVHLMQVVVYASPLPLLVFGIGCLCAHEWARRAGIALLTLQCLALLLITHQVVDGIHLGNIQYHIPARHGYFVAAAIVFFHGFLIEFLLRARGYRAIDSKTAV